ncbi:MAG: DsbA family protein [Proteobacteria bacterium]|nr:DsbA family protein [Pseudomonadota bacterium]
MPKLIYVADPMCSWCWGYKPTLDTVRDKVGDSVDIQYVMGGLARDSDEPMPAETQAYVKGQWDKVAQKTGAAFNWDFWDKCKPRRSTYPACRAVIAASLQGKAAERAMFEAIQHAYYQEARNPSDVSTLLELASELGLDQRKFAEDLRSEAVETLLQEGFQLRRSLNANQFPSLILEAGGVHHWVTTGYADSNTVLRRINEVLQPLASDT